jgi:predicted  nucleic acid-binding Zn-ribbon protein
LTPKPTTIDLKANAVSKAAGSGSVPKTGKSAENDKAKTAAAKADATGSSAKPASASASSESKKPSQATAAETTTKAKAQTPRSASQSASRQTQRGGGTSILAMVLAGGVGGIITLLGAYALLGSGLLATMDNDGADETRSRISEISGSLADLSDQSNLLSNRLADLDGRLTALADQPADTSVTDSLQSDIETLRAQLDAVVESGQSDLDTETTAQNELQQELTTLQQQLADLSNAMSSQNEALSGAISSLTEQQTALESSVAGGQAGEAPALAALDTRLTNLSEQMTVQADQINSQISSLSEAIPAPVRAELNTLGEMVTNLQDQLSIMESLQLASQQQQLDLQSLTDTVEGVAGTVKRVAGKTDRLEETVSAPKETQPDAAMTGARLAYVQEALQTAVAGGVPFAGLLSQARTALADSESEVVLPEPFVEAAEKGLTPLEEIASQIAEARAARDTVLSQATAADETAQEGEDVTARGLLDGIVKGAKGLVTIRKVDETGAAPPDVLSAQLLSAENAANAGNLAELSSSLQDIAVNAAASENLQQSVAFWLEQTRHHQTVAGLQDQLGAVQQSIWAEASKGDPS